MEAVVLAAGAGTRMRPLCATRPKALLPVAGRPLVAHVLDRAVAAGVTTIHLVVHHGAGHVRTAMGDEHEGAHIVYHDQGQAGGTGHALTQVQTPPKKPFLLLSCDTLVAVKDLEALVEAGGHHRFVVGAHETADATKYGALETQGDRLLRIHEKSPSPPSDLVNTGTYLLDPRILKTLRDTKPSPRGEIELTDALNEHAKREEVHVQALADWIDVGRPWDLLHANRALLEERIGDSTYWHHDGNIENGVHLVGPVRVEADATVRAGSVIEGPTVIQSGARVGPLAYIRPHTVIGRNSHIGAHTEIKNSILFDDANAPHLNYVGDSVIGSGVNLGAGTTIANLRHDGHPIHAHMGPHERVDTGRRKFGAVIADHAKTGINVALDCGTVIGPGALLAPGQSYHGHLEGDRIHYAQGKSGPRTR